MKHYNSFLRHVDIILSSVDYPDISKHGAKVANAYRLARKELRKLKANGKDNILSSSPKTL